nr:MAG TPA: hypothetical protein [Caudoviricetes sp.]
MSYLKSNTRLYMSSHKALLYYPNKTQGIYMSTRIAFPLSRALIMTQGCILLSEIILRALRGVL